MEDAYVARIEMRMSNCYDVTAHVERQVGLLYYLVLLRHTNAHVSYHNTLTTDEHVFAMCMFSLFIKRAHNPRNSRRSPRDQLNKRDQARTMLPRSSRRVLLAALAACFSL